MTIRIVILLSLLCAAAAAADTLAPITGGFCAGDCNNDGTVRVDELITAVTIALGSAGLDRCAAANVQEDTVISISELIGAVNSALSGCP